MTDHSSITLRGVRVHNLRGLDLELPLRKLTVISGVSGAGKSSLAFDTLYTESQRRYLESFSAYTRQFLERLDRPEADYIGPLPPAIAVSQRKPSRNPRATVGTLTEIVDYLRLLFSRAGTMVCQQCGGQVQAHRPADVVAAFQHQPPGTRITIAFPWRTEGMSTELSALKEEGFLRIQVGSSVYRLDQDKLPDFSGQEKTWVLVDRLETGKSSPDRLNDSIETAFSRGGGRMALLTSLLPSGESNGGESQEILFDQRFLCPRCDRVYPLPQPRLFNWNDPLGACPVCEGTGVRDKNGEVCPSCHGSRLGDFARCVRLGDRGELGDLANGGGKNIAELCSLPISQLLPFFRDLPLPEKSRAAAGLLLDQMHNRLSFLHAVELGYLSLDRPAHTLSSGEARRVRLTTALGSNLVNALYIFDEPTVGLHPRDTEKVLREIIRLRDAGNTVVLIEHDPAVFRAADYMVDLGPGAGEEGGEALYQGPPEGLASCEGSVTGAFLSSRRTLPVPSRRRAPNRGQLRIVGARAHNLQNLNVDFPLGLLCVVTGVSGAGKSTLVQETLYPALCRRKHKKMAFSRDPNEPDVLGAGQIGDVVLMDQEPLARTARSNAATFLKIFDDIRAVFAETAEAKIRNFGPGFFSFNQSGGRCDTCEGQGILTVDMQFLPDVTMTCPDCHGSRFKKEVLLVKVRNLNIAEVLNLTAREAFRFFRAQTHIERRLKFLLDVGLDYIRLGQPTETLSGGECQRLKLAGHLSSSRKPRCLFLLDEPTAGLHLADVIRLLDCFDRLLEAGHSIILVEHNLDVIKCADWILDLGPGAGAEGGRLVAAGPPEEIARIPDSCTGQWLQRVLPDICPDNSKNN